MPNRVRMLTVPEPDRVKLERRARDRGAAARVVERARIVLLAAVGLTGPQIAERVGCTEPTVIKWRRQYAGDGLAGLEDAPRPGGPKTVLTETAIAEILSATVTPPPDGAADPRLRPARRDLPVRSPGYRHRPGHRRLLPAAPAPGVPALPEEGRRRLPDRGPARRL